MNTDIESSCLFIEQYAEYKNLINLKRALPKVKEDFLRASEREMTLGVGAHGYTATFHHSLAVTKMLIELRVPVSKEEEDILLAAAICHAVPTCLEVNSLEDLILCRYELDAGVYEILSVVVHDESLNEQTVGAYFEKVRQNKFALLLRLADRSSIVERLYDFATWRSNRYIEETIEFYFPMCIYAKEHYPEFMMPVTILMEKIKSLMEVGEILIGRFSVQEKQLLKEIMTLREENARIRGSIRKLKGE